MQTPKGTVTRNGTVILEDTTENQLTLTAMDEALGRIRRPVSLTIWTDCDFVAAALRQGWPEKWKEADWKNAKGKPVADAEKWQSVLVRISVHEVSVNLNEKNEYAGWMKRELLKVAPVQQKEEKNV